MTAFRPCIDLHNGQVKQIVGGTLTHDDSSLRTNFVASNPAQHYAAMYRDDNLSGGHVIKLGPGNDDAARAALSAYPKRLQIGGGITSDNAQEWLDAGAEKVIVTSYLFPESHFSLSRLQDLVSRIGKQNLVIDLSCRRKGEQWIVAMNKWTSLTDMAVNQESISMLEQYCSEFLIHAADVEGLCQGVDEDLVKELGEWCSIPCTYAGGAKDISDLELVSKLSSGKVDLTFGSALDIFGGKGVKYVDLVEWNQKSSSA